MEEYKVLVNETIKEIDMKMPIHNGTVSEYQKRLEVFSNLLERTDQILSDLANKFIKNKGCTLEEIDKIKEINKEVLNSIIILFKSNK